jgi:outer membrane protein assembly factor BamB
MRKILSAFLATASVSCLAATEPMFRGGPAHAGVADSAAPREFGRVKWTFPTGNRIVSSPVLHDGAIYFGSDDGNVYAVDAASGRQRWKRPTRGPVPSTPAIAGGTVYVTSYDGQLYALDARNGSVNWKFATGGERHFEARGLHGWTPSRQTFYDPFDVFLSSPVVAQGAVFFGSGDGHLYAVDAATGALRWKFATGDVIHASPAYADGVLYVGSWDSYFYAVDAASGREKWRFHAGEDPVAHNQVGFQSSAAVVDGVVYVGCRDSNLYALDAGTGAEKWRFNNAGSWVIASPAVAEGKVVFATSDSSLLHILDAATGKPVAKQQSKAFMFASPVVAGRVILQPVLNGTLEARDLADGALLWQFRTAASKANLGWALTSDGHFNMPLLYRSGSGESGVLGLDRQLSAGAMFSTPLVAAGTIYIGSTDGSLYALE